MSSISGMTSIVMRNGFDGQFILACLRHCYFSLLSYRRYKPEYEMTFFLLSVSSYSADCELAKPRKYKLRKYSKAWSPTIPMINLSKCLVVAVIIVSHEVSHFAIKIESESERRNFWWLNLRIFFMN